MLVYAIHIQSISKNRNQDERMKNHVKVSDLFSFCQLVLQEEKIKVKSTWILIFLCHFVYIFFFFLLLKKNLLFFPFTFFSSKILQIISLSIIFFPSYFSHFTSIFKPNILVLIMLFMPNIHHIIISRNKFKSFKMQRK